MKLLLPMTVILALTACSGASGTTPATPVVTATPVQQLSDQPLRDSVQRLAVAWNGGDGAAWAGELWPDGSLVNILGVVFPNQAAVAAVTNQILAGPFHGSTFAPSIRRVRFIGTDAAIVDADISVTGFRALPPGAVATEPGLLLTRFTFVFENRGGVWKIESAQNTAVLPAPATPAPTSPA